MRIDTSIAKQEISVEIEDKEYPVIEKTVETGEKILKIISKLNKATAIKPILNSTVWLEVLEVLLGKDAVKELFPKGDKENMDRMQLIYYGCLGAYNSITEQIQNEQEEEKAKPYKEQIKEFSEVMKDVEKLNNIAK